MKKSIFSLATIFICLSAWSLDTKDLKYIGMPIGGIGAGQVYLGGDGQLWYWDIFNYKRIQPGGPGDKFYINPIVQDHRFDQGFAIRIKGAITPTVKALREGGFSNICFNGQYPVGNVSYKDDSFPIEVQLQAFSPFIPTNSEESGFPVVIMEYTLKNIGATEVEAELFGWLQNTSNLFSSTNQSGKHINTIIKSENGLQLVCSSTGNDLTGLPDYGNMTLTLLGNENQWSSPVVSPDINYNLTEVQPSKEKTAQKELGQNLTGALGRTVKLKPGEKQTVRFILSWYYPNLHRKESGFDNLKNRQNL